MTELDKYPGYLIRRLHQIAVGVFLTETERSGLTPIQFAALQAVHLAPNVDQKTLANTIGLDTSTTGGVIDRLEIRGLLDRNASENDRRVRLLRTTKEGEKVLKDVMPLMMAAQQRILSPLSATDQKAFMKFLTKLVNENNELSRVPSNKKISQV